MAAAVDAASLPYLTPGGPYAEDFARNITKRLVFSSWTATPTAIAALLSYDADRHIVEGTRLTERTTRRRRSLGSRLTYRTERGPRTGHDQPGVVLADAETGRRRRPASPLPRAAGPVPATQLNISVDTSWVRSPRPHHRPRHRRRSVLLGRRVCPARVPAPTSRRPDRGGPDRAGRPERRRRRSRRPAEPHRARRPGPPVDRRRRSDPIAPTSPKVAALAAHSPGNIAYRALRALHT